MNKKIIIMILTVIISVSSFLCFGGMTLDGLDNEVYVYFVDEMGRTLSANTSFVEAPSLEGYITKYTLMNKMAVFPDFEVDFTQDYERIAKIDSNTGLPRVYVDVLSNDMDITREYVECLSGEVDLEKLSLVMDKYLNKFGKTGFYQACKHFNLDGSSCEDYWNIDLFATPFEVNFGESFKFSNWYYYPSTCDIVLLIDGKLYDMSVPIEGNSGITFYRDMYSLEMIDMCEELYGSMMYSFHASKDFVINESLSIYSIGGVTRDNVKIMTTDNISDISNKSNLQDYVFNNKLYVQVSYEKIEELPPIIVPDEENGPIVDNNDSVIENIPNNAIEQFFVDIKLWFIDLGNDIKQWFVDLRNKIKGLFV